jgi:hypothetical protein
MGGMSFVSLTQRDRGRAQRRAGLPRVETTGD